MDIEQNVVEFSSMSDREQATVLAQFAYELTVLARQTYVPGGEGLVDPEMMRRINELQHRICDAIVARLLGEETRYPDDVIVRMSSDPTGSAVAEATADLFGRILSTRGARQS